MPVSRSQAQSLNASRTIALGCGQGEINNGCLQQLRLINTTAKRLAADRLGNKWHEFIEVLVTHCVCSPRADKMAIEIDVVADDALDCAIRRAVEEGIYAVSS